MSDERHLGNKSTTTGVRVADVL